MKKKNIIMATSEIVWELNLFWDLKIPQQNLALVYCDSIAAIHIVANPVFHEKTKHIKVDCPFVREK